MKYYKVSDRFGTHWMAIIDQHEADILRPSQLHYDAYILNPEVWKWCETTFGKKWRYKIKKFDVEWDGDHTVSGENIVEVFFQTEEDLLMFTMRWVGGKSE